jgi:hypothetical protein
VTEQEALREYVATEIQFAWVRVFRTVQPPPLPRASYKARQPMVKAGHNELNDS